MQELFLLCWYQLIAVVVIWRSVSAELFYSFRLACACLCVCACARAQREGKWRELCLHRGVQICPQSHRSSTTVPLRGTTLIPHLLIYVAWIVPEVEIQSILLCLLIELRNVSFLNTRRPNIVLRITHCQLQKCAPTFQQQHNRVGVCFMSWSAVWTFGFASCLRDPWGAVFETKTGEDFSCCVLNGAEETQMRHSHRRPRLLRCDLWMRFTHPSYWLIIRQPSDTPVRRAAVTAWTCVWTCSPLLSRRPVLTDGKTSTTTRSTSSHMGTAPSFPPLCRAGPSLSSLATKVRQGCNWCQPLTIGRRRGRSRAFACYGVSPVTHNPFCLVTPWNEAKPRLRPQCGHVQFKCNRFSQLDV